MKTERIFGWLWSGAVMVAAAVTVWSGVDAGRNAQRDHASMAVQAEYGSLPKGVVLEQPLTGLPPVNHVAYDARAQRYILNQGAYSYACPVTPADFAVICRALAADRRFGVSIKMDKSAFTLNRMLDRTAIARDLTMADQILGGTVLAIQPFLRGIKLPRNFQPKAVAQRRIWTVSMFRFLGYQVAGVPGTTEFRRANFLFTPVLFPSDQFRKTPEGGHIPDRALMAKGIQGEPEDIENLKFLIANQREFFAMPAIARTIDIGEGVAFARFLQQCGMDLNQVAQSMR